jgi:hypothetical protein
MAAARDALERSGESVAELAQKHADWMERIRREAQQRYAAAPADTSP